MGQFHDINEIFYAWLLKCCTGKIYSDGPMLKEEAMEIKKCLNPEEYQDFTASNKWLMVRAMEAFIWCTRKKSKW